MHSSPLNLPKWYTLDDLCIPSALTIHLCIQARGGFPPLLTTDQQLLRLQRRRHSHGLTFFLFSNSAIFPLAAILTSPRIFPTSVLSTKTSLTDSRRSERPRPY